MKYLGIDYGSKRTGVAVSDAEGSYAFPKMVLVTGNGLVGQVKKCVAEYGVQAIVLGESRDYKGAPNKILKNTLSFKKELEGLTGLPVYLEREFMTSVQADRLQKDLGGDKDMIDATAAAFILQSFLDKNKNSDKDVDKGNAA